MDQSLKCSEQRVLITGGAGYIGAFVRARCLARGHTTLIFDHFESSSPESVTDCQTFTGDLRNQSDIVECIQNFAPTAVIHLASLSDIRATEGIETIYEQNNVEGSANLLRALDGTGAHVVFASSASIYAPSLEPLREDSALDPISIYSRNKLRIEQMLAKQEHGLTTTALRLCVVAGQSPDIHPNISEAVNRRLIPIIARHIVKNQPPCIRILGTDLPTPDGTCIRDYIHVEDVAAAFVAAFERPARSAHNVYTIGTGTGTSVHQAIEIARTQYGEILTQSQAAHPNDPYAAIPDISAARTHLHWQPSDRRFKEVLDSEVQFVRNE